MAILRCKMCGGDLKVIEGHPFATCLSCGTKQTYPHIEDDEITERYNLGNYERLNNNFDTAFSIFSDIAIRSRGDEPEAYWNTMLCRFGILYQTDYRTHQSIPTLNRTQMNSVYEDPGYQKAIEYADPDARLYYEQQAEKIEALRKKYLNVINSEEPYDVFICYKETDDGGMRTEDSIEAQNLYDYLTKEGFNVFLSRVTLADIAGMDYEPYIYAALNSAKVMFVFGSREEYVNAPWVRNEWSRYLSAIKGDFTRLLIPVYKNDPSYFPPELKMLQGFNLSAPGWFQDAKMRVDKVTGKKKQQAEPLVRAYSGTTGQLYENAQTHLRLGNNDKALQIYQEMTEKYPSDPRGWWGVLSVKTNGFRNTTAFEKNKDNFIKLYRDAWTLSDEKKKADLEHEWDQYLKTCSSFEVHGSSGKVLSDQISDRIETAQDKIKSIRGANVGIQTKINDLYASRELGRGKPNYKLDDPIEEAEAKKSAQSGAFILSMSALVVFSLLAAAIYFDIDNVFSVILMYITCAACAVIGFFIGQVIGAVVGFFGFMLIGASFPSFTAIVLVISSIACLIFGFISRSKSKKAEDELKSLQVKKEEEKKEIQKWHASFDTQAEALRSQIKENEQIIDNIQYSIDAWRDWGWYKNEDGSYEPKKDEFEELAYQMNRKKTGLKYDLGVFGGQLDDLEKKYALSGTDIINIEKKTIRVAVVWRDNNDREGMRPDEVELLVTGSDGKDYEVVLEGEGNRWSAALEVTRYDNAGKEVTFTLDEEEVDCYRKIINNSLLTITNMYEG